MNKLKVFTGFAGNGWEINLVSKIMAGFLK